MPLGGHPCPQCDETHRGCPRRAPGASCGTARENRGAVAGMGSGLPGAGQGRDHWEVRRGGARRRPRKDKGRMPDGVCSVTGWSREGARRRLVAAVGRPPGRGRSEPGEGRASTPDGRSEDPPAGAGRPAAGSAVSTSRSPCRCCQACWRRGGELDGEPRYGPAVRAGPGGHERDGPSTAISPRPGPAPCAAGPRPRAGPGFRGSIKIRRAGGRGGGSSWVLWRVGYAVAGAAAVVVVWLRW